ncbi:maleylpyruvate isomerase family mycothiol-dependent enzyme [Rhodococcus opacus]|uniref:maleylpyruvate isomerase family mycothiol-dependent enzyme n=1 Tax=Rhodococcus opacus TaxID=37919 RepID=UPI002472FE65|nr:maleylpyruvate isomerase family mycothiol-dependent enzyme [Rhodococcus opacus]MDH6291970.1 uncharacterized protein (TIGR03083 family) [Rhodococcus opacus]
MNPTDTDLQALVGPQFQALADALTVEPETIADAPSLCEGWSVRHVVAHVTMAARYDGPAFMRELAAAGHNFDVLSETIARRDSALPFDTLLDNLRSDTMAAWTPPGGGSVGALSHVVIHGLDITAATGLPRIASDEATRIVLSTLTGSGAQHFGIDVTGRFLRATDLDWRFGEGPALEAPAGDLILALAGRPRPGVDLSRR